MASTTLEDVRDMTNISPADVPDAKVLNAPNVYVIPDAEPYLDRHHTLHTNLAETQRGERHKKHREAY